MQDTFSGQSYAPFTTTGVAVKARPGRVARVIITTAVTGSVTIYDNTAASGQVVFTAPSLAVGTYPIDVPCRTGIFLVPGSAGAGIVTFS